MLYKCGVKTCPNQVDHHVRIGPLDVGVCSSHHEAAFELGRRFSDEYNNMARQYFELILNLKTGG